MKHGEGKLLTRLHLRENGLAALYVGSFIAWNGLAFRVIGGPRFSFPFSFLSYPRSDESWLAALAAMAIVATIAALAFARARGRGGLVPLAGINVSSGRDMVVLPQRLTRAGHVFTVAGTVLMVFGTIGLLLPDPQVWFIVCCGVICGVGMALFLLAWVPRTVYLRARVVLLRASFGFLVATLLDVLVAVLPWSMSLVLVALFPVVTCVTFLIACDKPIEYVEEYGEFTEVTSSATDALTLCLATLGFAFFMGILGFDSDILAPEALLLDQTRIMAFSALLAACITFGLWFFSSPALLQMVIPLVLATALVLLPVTAGSAYAEIGVVLDQTTLLLIFILMTVVLKDGDGHRVPLRRFAVLLAVFAFLDLFGTLLGGVVRSIFGLDLTAMTLMTLFVLYFIFLVIVVLFKNGHRVEHVIKGTVASEEEMARIRCEVLAEHYPQLSLRELEVLLLMLQNYSNARMADALVVSENTVKTHVRHIYARMGINSRQQLFAIAEAIPIRDSRRDGS